MNASPTALAHPHSEIAALPAIEWPTILLALAAYGGWLALTDAYGTWPAWFVVPAMALLLTFHSSLQHEILHGHPTRSAAVNRLFGILPLSLWIPYDRFRALHMTHHINDRLTDPIDDPESNYVTAESWSQRSAFNRLLFQAQLTLAGRMLIGSWWRMGWFLTSEARAFARNQPGVRAAWITHTILCAPVVYWIAVRCGIPLWLYFVGMVVPANGILLVRSFAEHRARADVPERTATVEGSLLLGPLFLFNNLHSLHHAEPLLPWYRYHARYGLTRDRLLAENGGLVYSSYFEVARRFLFTMHDQPQHPLGRAPSRRAA